MDVLYSDTCILNHCRPIGYILCPERARNGVFSIWLEPLIYIVFSSAEVLVGVYRLYQNNGSYRFRLILCINLRGAVRMTISFKFITSRIFSAIALHTTFYQRIPFLQNLQRKNLSRGLHSKTMFVLFYPFLLQINNNYVSFLPWKSFTDFCGSHQKQ